MKNHMSGDRGEPFDHILQRRAGLADSPSKPAALGEKQRRAGPGGNVLRSRPADRPGCEAPIAGVPGAVRQDTLVAMSHGLAAQALRFAGRAPGACALALLFACSSGASAPDGGNSDADFADAPDGAGAPCAQLPPEEPSRPAAAGEHLRASDLGRVGHIVDGDTLDVVVDGVAHRVRVHGIDSPECEKEAKQVDGVWRNRCIEHPDNDWWGYEAYCELVNLASGAGVRVTCEGAGAGEPCPVDAFDRALAHLGLDDGTDLGGHMLGAGAAWTFTRFACDERAPYCDAEDAAKLEGAGMWSVGVPEVLARMSADTLQWYQDRDTRCAQAQQTGANARP
jgi:endonuclease YncB( thermonuclease family)